MDGFGFDIGGGRRVAGGRKSSSHSHSHHHRRHHGGGDFGPPPPPDDDGGDDSGDDGSGADDGGDMGAEFHRHGGECHCGGTCASCQGGNARRLGWRGRFGPDLYQSRHCAPMGSDDPGWTGQYGPDLYSSGTHVLAGDPDDFGCDPLGSCSGRYAAMKAEYGWEYDGPGSFGGDLTPPILSNWGRYPSRSPLKGVFAGDLSMPILSNWGRYPSRSPLKGVFGDDLSDVVNAVGSVAQTTAAVASALRGTPPNPPPPPPPSPVQRINQDPNPTTSGQGGVIDAVNAVARGNSSIVAAKVPAGTMVMPMDTITAPRPHHRHHPQQLQPLPFFGPTYTPPPMYSPVDIYGRPAPVYDPYTAAIAYNPYYRSPGY
jgi:hypothetical protein